MEIKQDQALTPEKKQLLIDQIKNEILLVSDSIKQKKYGTAAFTIIQQKQSDLQSLLNNILDKKGIITPSETNNALDKLNQSKRARLEKGFYMGIKKSTLMLIGFAIVGVGAYILIKKSKKWEDTYIQSQRILWVRVVKSQAVEEI